MTRRKKETITSVGVALLLALTGCSPTPADRIIIDAAQKGDEVPTSLYGVFFEEITHSGDGGLYAEMVMNRGFEEGTLPSGTTLRDGFAVAKALPCYSNDSINHFKVAWPEGKELAGWQVKNASEGIISYAVVDDQPLHPATPHALHLNLSATSAPTQVINEGYRHMAVREGKNYKITFYLKADAASGSEVAVSLVNENGEKRGEKRFPIRRDNQWNKYEGMLHADATDNKCRLALEFPAGGNVYLDYVSLFPEETFKGRPNGMREDVSEVLADLRPAFVRWPGGCIVEGLTMENRVKWKETIGDPMTRPGEYNLWGYRSTYGFGYHEFLQFCEDIGAEGMFVCNAGMSCLFRNGDFYDDKQVDGLIQEALDAIEYAIGDTDTYWGKKRMENGHPEPFPLKYVEVGNENVGSRYAANYKRFHAAIKAKYPQITPICALMFSPYLKEAGPIDIIDPHYYETADWFYRNGDVYDKLPEDYPYKIYVGEYAATGRPTLYSSLAEAAFLTGVERNSDKVQLVSYAPLLENADKHGRNHLIILKNDSVYGRANYHVMRMFAQNRPDFNLATRIESAAPLPAFQTKGIIGIGTCNTTAEFKDLKVTQEGKELYATNWGDLSQWQSSGGSWDSKDAVLGQYKQEGDAYYWLPGKEFSDCVIELKARKIAGREGFRIFFGSKGESRYFMADIGSHTNESVIFGERGENGNVSLFDYRNTTSVCTNHWYDIRIEVKGNHWKCFLDGKLEYEYTYQPLVRHYAVSGYDEKSGEMIIKLVNGENHPWETNIQLDNVGSLGEKGKVITLASADPDAENSFANPNAVAPVEEELTGIAPNLRFTCKPNSLTIIRIPSR